MLAELWSVHLGRGESLHLRTQPRRTVENNKLFGLQRIRACWWERLRTECLGGQGREYSRVLV